jgi:tetratricopeptide (TPR) repeat protein
MSFRERNTVLIGIVTRASRRLSALTLTTVLLALPACSGDAGDSSPAQGGQAGAQVLSDEAQALVAQGNEAQRSGRYQEALEDFSKALEMYPNHPVPQFGTLMAATAVGDTALARSMREKLEETGPELLEMLGPGGAMGQGGAHVPGGGMPPGHPNVETAPDDTVSGMNKAG